MKSAPARTPARPPNPRIPYGWSGGGAGWRRMIGKGSSGSPIPARSFEHEFREPERDLREGNDDAKADQLQDHEGDDALIDVGHLHRLRGDALQVEESESEWRSQK